MATEDKPLLSSYDVGIRSNGSDGFIHYDSFPNHIHSPGYSSHEHAEIPDNVESENVKEDGQPADHLKVYKRRWYIIVSFGLFAFCQNFIWNTWGPISSSAEDVFGWHDSTIAWQTNWGPVSFIVSGLFFPWLLQAKGLRWATLSSAFLVSVGTTLRVITSETGTATILIHVGQFLNGLGGPISMGAIPQLSATWFPPKERVTCTALGTCIGMLGSAFSFVVGPLLVSDHHPSNNSDLYSNWDLGEKKNGSDSYIQTERDEIMRYMYYSCGSCWLITLIILIYFPAKPPRPPAISACTEREKYWAGLWSLRIKGAFLIVAFTYGISLGVLNCWNSVLDVNLKPFGISEKEAGWIGFYSVLGGGVTSLLVGRFADYFTRYMKLFIVALYLLGTGALIVFALMLKEIIPFSHELLYSSNIIATTVLNAATPLLFELACELAYPTSEGAANGFLTYVNNVAGLIFLAIFSVPHIGTMWMNWTVIGSTVVCIPLIGSLRGRFKRLEVDEQVNPEAFIADQEITVSSENDQPPPYDHSVNS